LTSFRDGSSFESTAGPADLEPPPTQKVQRVVGASVAELWSRHGREGSLESFGKLILSAHSQEETLALLNAAWATTFDYHVRRGLLVPCSSADEQAVKAGMAATGSETDPAFAAVYAEIERLVNRKAGWLSGVLTLLVTAALFCAVARHGNGWIPLTLIAGILFFHELGHLAAMRLFGYRNLRVFFIPFLGAAVTGQNYNVPAWKKAVVSLMGPLPGIVLGAALGLAAALCRQPMLLAASALLLGINAFNLLPLLPLDGGRVVHAVLFSRHPMLDVTIRAAIAAALVLGGIFEPNASAIFGVLMLLALPMTYRVAQVVRRLRQRGFDATSLDARTIPLQTARSICDELRQVVHPRTNTATLAQLTLRAFELLNARPPGWLASFALVGIQGLSIAAAVAILVALFLPGRGGALAHAWGGAGPRAKCPLACQEILTWAGANAGKAGQAPLSTIVANLPNRKRAETWFRGHRAKLPPQATATLFGQTVMVTLPAGDNDARKHWLAALEASGANVAVQSALSRPRLVLTCRAPNAATAAEIAEEANLFFDAPPWLHLAAPWSPEQPLSDAMRTARRTYRMVRKQVGIWAYREDPRWISLFKAKQDAQRKGDVEAVRKLASQQDQVSRDIVRERLQKLRREGEAKWDIPVIDLYEQILSQKLDLLSDNGALDPAKVYGIPAKRRQEADRLWRKLGSRLGQLPMDNSGPPEAAKRFSTHFGAVPHSGRNLRFELIFERPSTGAPALVRWLCGQGCTELRYDFALADRKAAEAEGPDAD
jgi:Zn-dependent protease